MKRNNILKGLGCIALAGTMVSCSSDYLDLQPETQVFYPEISTTPTALRMAAYGLCEGMYSQYAAMVDPPFSFNGEPALSMIYGEVPGQDYVSLYWQQLSPNVLNWAYVNSDTGSPAAVAWAYCYTLINEANIIIENTKDLELKGESAFRVAQAYTFRAHAYTRLVQIYGPRWEDSKNGSVETCVLRLNVPDPSGNTGAPMATNGEVLNQIYGDLDTALELYETSGMMRSYNWEPDAQIAKGLYARAALLKNDWATAQKMAHDARQGYAIMSASDYEQGFAVPTSEWMWNSSNESAGLYYVSFGASYACNGAYPALWGTVGAGAIDYDFYRTVANPNDVRCQLFFTPDKVGFRNQSYFWNENTCAPNTMNVNRMPNSPLSMELATFAKKRYDITVGSKGWEYPFNVYYGEADKTPSHYNPTSRVSIAIQFGAQFKFWGTDSYSSSSFPFMRASEMALIEAEAACMQEDYTTAQNCVNEINKNRVTKNYKDIKLEGAELLLKIQDYRRLELWGEGFSWFDFKRWGKAISRVPWVQGSSASGNWPQSYRIEIMPSDYNGWVYPVPRGEWQYNTDLMGKE